MLKAIHNAAKRWELFVQNRRSQYPWEAAFNGWVISADAIEFPPSRQGVLLHPALGVEASIMRSRISASETVAGLMEREK